MSAARRTGSNRRDFLVSASTVVGVAALAGALTSVADAKALPHVTAQDPQAQSLHYTEDASTLDAGTNPTHTAGARCASCQLYQGKSGDAFGPCLLYPGRAVSVNGWCMGYQKKA